ncbi:LPS assembly lipoprotein LptE [Xanthomonas campestris]|uniref:LPS-assembly lipoprotein LptE n=1 Tax=Xanthomonas campestris TaxID=339 RepID=UPI000E328D70|nr:LPS assembly lipoprotein LptE [Xanthomonas campestris]MEA9647094.1 LPS assembly lipoprotein LptE [Xanthomonas campestris WHRI 8523]MEA9670727.1 LPS assembly lipoprotein LptE [Xanthomonas campestris]MEA9686590.1 LPS assembly lipoprotein LptE [Xanthomonas campestris]MEA9703057.1 LPS assembly lipoprotein LptE [Xanthomonas campestris]RFF58497.1 hypothetical protein D0A41_00620 [Xanthomonas campestris]
MIRFPTAFAASLVLVSSLTACGFHLRNSLALPPDTPAVKVQSALQYSELAKLLRRGLKAAGATLADDDAKSGFAKVQVLSERWGDLPIAIDSQGRSQEFSLRYAAIFTVTTANGAILVPQQVIELSRDYVSPPVDATGTATEREILADELRKDMSASILRRIDSVVRARVERGESLESTPTAPLQPSTTPPVQPSGTLESSVPASLPPAPQPSNNN